MGDYTSLTEKFSSADVKSSFLLQLSCGLAANGTGAFIGTPAEVSLIRITADNSLPLEQKRNYKNVFNALSRIVSEEGVRALWTGCRPTIGRAMLVNNLCQLASYSQAKQRLVTTGYFQDEISLHFCASMISSLITTFASKPFDIAKTRLQNMKVVDGKPQYEGTIDVLVRVIKNEGFFSLWRGFTSNYARLGPHTLLTFIILEQLNALYKEKLLS